MGRELNNSSSLLRACCRELQANGVSWLRVKCALRVGASLASLVLGPGAVQAKGKGLGRHAGAHRGYIWCAGQQPTL